MVCPNLFPSLSRIEHHKASDPEEFQTCSIAIMVEAMDLQRMRNTEEHETGGHAPEEGENESMVSSSLGLE